MISPKTATRLSILSLIALALACSKKSDSSSSSSTSSYAGPGSHYTFNITGSSFSVNKYATKSSSTADFTVTGSSEDISATGFKKLTVETVNGTGGPSVGDIVYGLEIPGVALFLKPLASGSNQVLTAVATGTCPTSNMSANWVIVKKASSSDLSSNTQDVYGTFSYNASTSVASLPSKYSLQNNATNLGASTFSSATCSNGVMTVDNGGGDTAVMYLTTVGAALVNTADSTSSNAAFILGMPASSVTGSSLAGNYAGILFSEADASEKIRPISMTLTWNGSTLSGSGTKVSDITTGATTGSSATLSLSSINSPSNGFLTGTLTAGSTTNIACMAVANINSSSKTVINCSGRDPGNSTKLFNFLLVSR